MRIAVQILCFKQNRWILKAIENTYYFADKIFITYSDKPWAYNKLSRGKIKNNIDIKAISESKWFDKIELISGDWQCEEDQRNDCLVKAKERGFDIMFIQDPDEFYHTRDLEKLKNIIAKNSQYSTFYLPWMCFWKSQKFVLEGEGGSIITGYPLVAINLNKRVKFSNKRNIKINQIFKRKKIINDITCFHYSFVLNDNECLDKISTWGHANELAQNWFNDKWIKWEETTENLHPVKPNAWKKAIIYRGNLPEIFKNDY